MNTMMQKHVFMYVFATLAISLLGNIENCEEVRILIIRDESLLNLRHSSGKLGSYVGVRSQSECATLCYRNPSCKSMFFNTISTVCQTNSMIYLSASGSVVDEGSVYLRKKIDCPAPPSIENSEAQFVVSSDSYVSGTVLEYACDAGYAQEGNVTCQVDGTWSPMSCNKEVCEDKHNDKVACKEWALIGECENNPDWMIPNCMKSCGKCKDVLRSCSDVRECNNQYEDGEYWIYPTHFGSSRVKIYCHAMGSTPSEYITLPVTNIGYYPPASNKECEGEQKPGLSKGGGETRYKKIQVDIETMEVNRTDPTFATTMFGNFQKYGEARDCYTIHYGGTKATCGPKGTFNVDTTGTGLIVSKSLEFPVSGWNPWGEAVRNADGSKIDLLCGGWVGGCRPNGSMQLELNLLDEPPESDAIVPTCV